MRQFLLIFLLCAVACFSGCSTSQERLVKHRNEAVAVAVYGMRDSIEAGRFDLAQKYASAATKIVAPPEKKVIIKPIYVTNPTSKVKEKVAVLPPAFKADIKVVIRESPELEEITVKQPEIKKQLEEEDKTVAAVEKQVEKVMREEERRALAPEKKSSTGWGWIWALITGGGVISLIAIAVFFPAALPLIQSIGSLMMGWFNALVRAAAGLFKKQS